MNLIIIHRNSSSQTASGRRLLRFAVSSEPIAGIVLNGLSTSLSIDRATETVFAIPQEWNIKSNTSSPKIIPYGENLQIPAEFFNKIKAYSPSNSWLVISNGRFAAQTNRALLTNALSTIHADVAAVSIEPELLAGCEQLRLTAQGHIAGIRRLYSHSAEPSPLPVDWPHHLFIKTDVFNRIFTSYTLPESFPDFIDSCRTNTVTFRAVKIAGTVLDLETESGLLNLCRTNIEGQSLLCRNPTAADNNKISQEARLLGKVLLGKNIEISPKVIIIGPAIIADNARLGQGAVINSSIIGIDVTIPRDQLIDNRILFGPQSNRNRKNNLQAAGPKRACPMELDLSRLNDKAVFRTWPRLSYARCFKRITDCVFAIIVLILFAPIIPFIALAIKLSSPGPIFFKDKRQGLHGKIFNCLKFRTMLVGADRIQDKLRVASEVDGPQFKMHEDPRLSTTGKFLRDTYIDEIPQFINVLLGQMSIIGPRPSPESENTLCPSWRDARLSVRPGITGLWQIRRTRKPMKDFQEWIYYDTTYVRNLSLKTDLWICWQTIKVLAEDFARQF